MGTSALRRRLLTTPTRSVGSSRGSLDAGSTVTPPGKVRHVVLQARVPWQAEDDAVSAPSEVSHVRPQPFACRRRIEEMVRQTALRGRYEPGGVAGGVRKRPARRASKPVSEKRPDCCCIARI